MFDEEYQDDWLLAARNENVADEAAIELSDWLTQQEPELEPEPLWSQLWHAKYVHQCEVTT
jgi:hypothetical protein